MRRCRRCGVGRLRLEEDSVLRRTHERCRLMQSVKQSVLASIRTTKAILRSRRLTQLPSLHSVQSSVALLDQGDSDFGDLLSARFTRSRESDSHTRSVRAEDKCLHFFSSCSPCTMSGPSSHYSDPYFGDDYNHLYGNGVQNPSYERGMSNHPQNAEVRLLRSSVTDLVLI